MMTAHNDFHQALRKIPASVEDTHSSYAFIFSTISRTQTLDDFASNVDLKACNWERIFYLATAGLVGSLLYTRIVEKGLVDSVPADFLQALDAIFEANAERNDAHRNILLEACGILNKHEIEPVLLKGAHALVGKMPDAKARIISDIDLLIMENRSQDAQNILIKEGFIEQYYKKEHARKAFDSLECHHMAPLHHKSGLGYIEIHRFPNARNHQPALVDFCFSAEKLTLAEMQGVRFFHSQPQELLIYNQIHNYYSNIVKGVGYDTRQTVEQAALCHQLGEAGVNSVSLLIDQNFTEFSQAHKIQLLLAKVLLEEKSIPHQENESDLIKQVNSSLGLILGNSNSIRNRKFASAASMLKILGRQIQNPDWLKYVLTKPDFYLELPQKMVSFIKNNRVL